MSVIKRRAEPGNKYANNIQPSYFYSNQFITSLFDDLRRLVDTYKSNSLNIPNSTQNAFDCFIKTYTHLGFIENNDNDAINAILFFIYTVYTTQPRDIHLYRLMHIPIEIDNLELLKSYTKNDLVGDWIMSQLKFTIHPSNTLLPRNLPATNVINHIPSADRLEQLVEELIRARECLNILETRLNLVKDGKISNLIMGEHLFDSEDEIVDIGLTEFNLSSEEGVEDLKKATTDTLHQLSMLESQAERMAIQVMKSYESAQQH
ncbi:hypothetical protein E3P92_01364 [Wallemia ichthyophaga]|nr:hypothetical protein E3P91_01073 [Wallemia ichthyophaga]TIB16492.1 hypothetical protein E3P92_01364 [Wallemia ichthyophaga]TIB64463.1 hypothetical protein E3P78_01220 [Wallemia ichthyophaga]